MGSISQNKVASRKDEPLQYPLCAAEDSRGPVSECLLQDSKNRATQVTPVSKPLSKRQLFLPQQVKDSCGFKDFHCFPLLPVWISLWRARAGEIKITKPHQALTFQKWWLWRFLGVGVMRINPKESFLASCLWPSLLHTWVIPLFLSTHIRFQP